MQTSDWQVERLFSVTIYHWALKGENDRVILLNGENDCVIRLKGENHCVNRLKGENQCVIRICGIKMLKKEARRRPSSSVCTGKIQNLWRAYCIHSSR